MTRAIPTGLNRRKASGRACPAASTRASHSGCSWSRYGSSETTLTVASATPSPVSWISSWYRGGSTASRAASSCGSRASRTATLFTSRWYGAAPGRGIHRKAEPAAATAGGGGAASRPPAATPVRAGNSPCCPMCRGGPPDHHDGMDFTTSARPGLRAPAAAPAPALTPAPWAGIALIAVAAVAVEMAVSARYGYVRDELYFLSAGQHLAFGYVDQPPLTPLLARITAALTGGTLVGFRILPALCLAALVVMTAAMSRRLGAGRTGQLLAALAAATCAEYLGAMHELTTTTPDFVFWALILLLVMRLLASRDPRWWLAIGGCGGARCRVAGRAWLARPGRVPRTADVGRAQPGRLLAGPGALHRPGADPGVGGRSGVVAAQRGGAAVPPGCDRLRDRDRTAVRPGRQGVLPGCRVHAPARGRLRPARAAPRGPARPAQAAPRGRLRPAQAAPRGPSAPGPPDRACVRGRDGDGGRRGTGRAGGAARAAGPGPAHRAAAEDQLRPRRGDRLAPLRCAGCRPLRRGAGRAAGADYDPGRELRRGGSDRPLRPRRRPAAGLQRRQQLLALGPAARR